MIDLEGFGDALDGFLSDVPSPGIDLEALDFSSPKKDLFADKGRKAWDKSEEARCDLARKVRFTKRSGVWFLSIWQKSVVGRTLAEIKADDSMTDFFASNAADLVRDVLGDSLAAGGWGIVTTPKRRHKERNFASMVSLLIAEALGIRFYEDAALCRSRQRVGAEFDLNVLPPEPNLIVFDDFVTTGQTLKGMKDLLSAHGKNLLFVAGINNKL